MSRLLLFIFFINSVFAQKPAPLTDSDKQLLIEALNKVQESSEITTTQRYDTALSAFKSALNSDGDVHALYLKCYEKVNFDDQNRKSQEFRDWRRRHKEREDTAEFRLALRHQLRWLMVLVQAAKAPEDISSLTPSALSAVDAIFADADRLTKHYKMLESSVLGTVFARAYEVNNLEGDLLPPAPLDVGALYEKLVFPDLRSPERCQSLRSAWTKRIKLEGLKLELWSAEGSLSGTAPPAYEKWVSGARYDLQWQMEVDCFKAGDEKLSAQRMLSQIQSNLTHKNAPKWIDEFIKMMKDDAVLAPTTEPSL